MNEERFDLKEIELELFQVKEVLRCILHTIIFNRALGLVKPREIDCEVFENVSYARVDDVHIHRMVETGIERFHQALEKSPTDHTGQVCLGLYEKQMKKNWFSSKEEKVFWERWILPIHITKEKPKTQAERDRRHAARSQAILDRLVYIIQCVNEKKDHIPPLNQQSTTVGVHFDISFTTGSATDESWGDSLKRMLKQGPPLLVKQP